MTPTPEPPDAAGLAALLGRITAADDAKALDWLARAMRLDLSLSEAERGGAALVLDRAAELMRAVAAPTFAGPAGLTDSTDGHPPNAT